MSSTRPISITVEQAAAILREVRGATAVSFTALTRPEQKANTVFGGAKIAKLVKVNAMTGCYYDRALMKATGEHANPERKWGQHQDSALVEKVGKDGRTSYYIPVQLNHVSRPLFLVPGVNGKLTSVPAQMVQPLLRQRPEQPVPYKDYSLASIVSLRIKGQRYRIQHQTA